MSYSGQVGVYFPARNGNRLLGSLFLAQGDAPKPTVLLLHGLPGIEKNVDIALNLRDAGWNSLIFHYQGCWGSAGDYRFDQLVDDTHAALDYLSGGLHEQVDSDQLYVVGHSMGGWTAVLTAVEDPRVKAVAIISAVCDPTATDWSDAFIEAEFTPWLWGMDLAAFKVQWAALGPAFTPTAQVHRLTQPLLVIHAEPDDVVPVEQARELVKQAPPNTTAIYHETANHSFTWHRVWLWDTLWRWLSERAANHQPLFHE